MADYAATFLHVNWIDVARYVLNRTEQYKFNQAAYSVYKDARTVSDKQPIRRREPPLFIPILNS